MTGSRCVLLAVVLGVSVARLEAKSSAKYAADGADGWRTPRGQLECIYARRSNEKQLDHWLQYGRVYEAHLPSRQAIIDRGRPVRMLEMGVQKGGSMVVWRDLYGDELVYHGVDVDANSTRYAQPSQQLFVHTGSQADEDLMAGLCRAYGPFDIVIDDAGHTADLMRASLSILVPRGCVVEGGWYVIEDTHTMARCNEGYCRTYSDISQIAADAFAGLHHNWWRGPGAKADRRDSLPASVPDWSTRVSEAHMYDSMLFLRIGPVLPLTRVGKMPGAVRFPGMRHRAYSKCGS